MKPLAITASVLLGVALGGSCTNAKVVSTGESPTAAAVSPSPTVSASPTTATSAAVVTVPDLVGKSVNAARKELSVLGVPEGNVLVSPRETADARPGTVLSISPSSGEDIDPATAFFILAVASTPPTPADIGRSVAETFAAAMPSREVRYAVLTSADGYFLKCDEDPCQQDAYRVRFGEALVVTADGKGGNEYRAMRDVIIDRYDDLRSLGFRYIAFGFLQKTGVFSITLGYPLSDWRSWGTSRQPSGQTFGQITNKTILKEFEPV